ncbi:MAG: DNA-binding protein [Marmoricola sp.]
MDDSDRLVHNLAQQTELYGAPLGESVREVTAVLGLSQAGVARVLGISAPMLSQLVSGQRIKLGNPQAVQRLQSLLRLAAEVDDGLAHDRIAPRLEEISTDETSTLSRSRTVAADVPGALSRLLRAVASGRELATAADLLAEHQHRELAEILRVYGTGRPHEAERHYAALARLLPGVGRGPGDSP